MRALAASVLVTIACVVGLVVVAVIGRPTPKVVQTPVEAVYVTPVATSTDLNRSATVRVTVGPAPDVLSTGAAGVVTSVVVRPGTALADGTVVYTVDGQAVFAMVTNQTLYRPLTVGDTGDDVAALQEFLARHTPVAVKPDGRFGPSTAAAVRAWQRSLGEVQTGVAEPSRFVRLDNAGTVDSVHVSVGHPGPTLGEVVVSMRPSVESLQVAVDGGVFKGDYILLTAKGKTALHFDGALWTVPQASDLLALVSPEGSAESAGSSAPATPVSSGQEGGSTLQVGGRLALATPMIATSLPAAALVNSDSGAGACVWRQSPTGPQRVEGINVRATTVSGAVLIDDNTLAGSQVLLDPVGLVVGAACP